MHPLLKRIDDRIAEAALGDLGQAELTFEISSIQAEIDFLAGHEGVIMTEFTTQLNILKSYLGGNATVPDNAPILPHQAFVDCFMKLADTSTQTLDFSNMGITHLDGDVLILKAYTFGATTMDLSDNALVTSEVDDILQVLAQYSIGQGTTVNLSGGTNGAPTNDLTHQDGVATFQLTDGAGNPNGYDARLAVTIPNNQYFNTLNIFEQGDASLDQSDGSSNNIYLHTGDGSSANDKAAFLATCAIFNDPAKGIHFSYNSSTKTVTLTFTNDVFLPLVSGETVAGSPGGNSSINALRGNGATVITN